MHIHPFPGRRLKSVAALLVMLAYVALQWGCEVSTTTPDADTAAEFPGISSLFAVFATEGRVESYTADENGVAFSSDVVTGGTPLFVSFGDVGADNTSGVGFLLSQNSSMVQPLHFDTANTQLSLLGAPFDSGLTDPRALAVDDENRLLFLGDAAADLISVFQYDETGSVTAVGTPFASGTGSSVDTIALHRIGLNNYLYASSTASNMVAAHRYNDAGTTETVGTPVDFGAGSITMKPYVADNQSGLDFLYSLTTTGAVFFGSLSRDVNTEGEIVNVTAAATANPSPGDLEVVAGGSGGTDFVTVTDPFGGALQAFDIDRETGALTENAASPIALIGTPGPMATQFGFDLFIGRFGQGGTTLNVFDPDLVEVPGSPFLLNSDPHDLKVNRFP